MAILKWNEVSQISHFRRGLRDEVKDLLMTCDYPERFDDFVKLCIRLDNRWHARYQERKPRQSQYRPEQRSTPSSSAPFRPTSVPSTTSGTHPGPMDLSTIRHLTPAEKKERREKNLCLYCRQPGHFASACPNKKKRSSYHPQKASQTTTTAASKEATKIPISKGRDDNGKTLYAISEPSKN